MVGTEGASRSHWQSVTLQSDVKRLARQAAGWGPVKRNGRHGRLPGGTCATRPGSSSIGCSIRRDLVPPDGLRLASAPCGGEVRPPPDFLNPRMGGPACSRAAKQRGRSGRGRVVITACGGASGAASGSGRGPAAISASASGGTRSWRTSSAGAWASNSGCGEIGSYAESNCAKTPQMHLGHYHGAVNGAR